MNKPLIPAQRRERIQEYLAVQRIARIADLSSLLGASEATIRRDLECMETDGIVERTHGGAVLTQRSILEPEYLLRAQSHMEEKRSIGMLAATQVQDGDIVFINSGTTTTQVLRYIRNYAQVTIITNNLSAALEIGPISFELILVGGRFQPKSNSVAGRFAIDDLSKIYASRTFIGVDGISLKHGFTVPSNAEAEVICKMIERTQGPVTLLADHSKWGVVSNYQIASFDQVHRLITDDGISGSARSALAARSIEVMIAGTSSNNN